jgi:DNA helicase II / ATP-dependent DNA helicase PcrA
LSIKRPKNSLESGLMSDTKQNDWQKEQDRVDFVVTEIDKKFLKLLQHAGKISSDVQELRKTFWEDVTVNFEESDDVIETHASIKQRAELLSERERSHGQINKQQKTLERLKNSPYFGRIDFFEKDEREIDQVYLGIASLMDENDENFLIYDWRAPISSMYYDYPPGPAHYQTPLETVDGVLGLKRQFIIRNASIKGMFDTGVTIGDEMLQEVLGNNANTQMKSIVATIQKEQNQIIRNERSKLVIVQGVAGSGKTSAALQRVAYLLYRYREILKSENIMLFSPNPLFNSYVSTVLPELGEENMKQTTFQEYLNHRLGGDFQLEDPFMQMEYLLSETEDTDYETRLKSIRYKTSLEFKEKIEEYVRTLSKKGILFKDISFRKNIIFSAEQIYEKFNSLDHSFTVPNRIELVKKWLLKELKKKAKLERTKSWVEEELQLLEKEDYLEAYNEIQKKEQFTGGSFDEYEREQEWLTAMIVNKRFKPIIAKVKRLKFIRHVDMYKELMVQISDIDKSVSTFTIENWDDFNMYYEDATPFIYLQDLIEGRKSNTSIRHVFIDEAQDYSPFQFAFIQKLFPNSKMTLLGDMNQAIYSGATGSGTVLSEPEGAFLEEESETIFLTRTYRSTKQIVEFTRELIAGGEKIEPFNREGDLPAVYKVRNFAERDGQVITLIKQLRNANYKTIAVICRTAKESADAYEALKDRIPAMLVEKGTISYEKGITIIPAYLAKGIEFDAVILYDSSQYKRESERKLFYTACTRAMHELYLIATEDISPLMAGVSKQTYSLC